MKRKIAIEIICYMFVILFTYTAVAKLKGYERFMVVIGDSPLIANFAELLVWAVPGLELVIAFMLVTNRFRKIGLYAAFTMMLIFTIYVFAILQSSEKTPCSCGGVLEIMSWSTHLVFNISFTLLALSGILLHSSIQENKNTSSAIA